jgi:peptidoglycan hydrolase-like protein with peptidoglycan-binding domain
MEFQLNAPLARNGNADADDVRRVKKALKRLGYFQPYEKVGITDIADAALFEALKTFQKDQGLTPSGAIKPGDDTEQALARESTKTPSGYYIWRTVEDGKVRGAHAALNRTVREWDDAPDPGEDFNCRCWAEPVNILQDKQLCIDLWNSLQKLRNEIKQNV